MPGAVAGACPAPSNRAWVLIGVGHHVFVMRLSDGTVAAPDLFRLVRPSSHDVPKTAPAVTSLRTPSCRAARLTTRGAARSVELMNNLVLSVTSSAAAGALTLVSPSGWSPRVRAAYVVGPGMLVAAAGAWALSRNTDEESVAAGTGHESRTEDVAVSAQRMPASARAGLLLGLGAATCGIQAGSLWIDAALERWLVGRGATHPRRWMALVAVLASLTMDAAGDRVSTLAGEDRRSAS